MKKESEDSGPTQNFLLRKLWEGEAGRPGSLPNPQTVHLGPACFSLIILAN